MSVCAPAIMGPSRLAVPVDDPAAREVIRRDLDLHAIAREDLDAEAAHLSGRVAQHLVAFVELDLEHSVREGLDDFALHLDLFFLRGQRIEGYPGRGKESFKLGLRSA